MSHRSRLTAVLIDVPVADREKTATFWGAALGREGKAGQKFPEYDIFGEVTPGIDFMVQATGDATQRIHLDIETDDIEAEVARLSGLGATQVARHEHWVIMKDPGRHRFLRGGQSSSRTRSRPTPRPGTDPVRTPTRETAPHVLTSRAPNCRARSGTRQDVAMSQLETRIAPTAPDDPIAVKYGGVPGRDGPPLNIFRTLAHEPDLFRAFSRLGGYLLRDGRLPGREREIVILRVGWRCGSEYEFGQHTVIGRAAGLTDDEIGRLARDSVGDWSAEDAALVHLADELCASDVVADSTWRALATRWDAGQLLELLVLAGYYRLVSGLLSSAGVALEPTTPGWPDGNRRPATGTP